MSVFGTPDPFKACVLTQDGHHMDPGPTDEEAANCKKTLKHLVSNQKVGAPHHLPAALKAHEFKNKPGDQRHHYPEQVSFAGHPVTFNHG